MKLTNILRSPGAPAVNTFNFEQTDVIQTLLSSIGLGLVVTDELGTIQLFNNAASDILGEPIANILPKEWPNTYRHGGRMWIESVFGQGTTFKFTMRAANFESLPCKTS